jgi:hypothetical protein
MNDIELAALTALVNQETAMMNWTNEERKSNGYAMAYTDVGPYFNSLEEEMKARRVMP